MIVSSQQILDLSDCVLRRVVQHTNWHKHGQIVRECAAKNEIESRLLDTEVDVFFTMPRVGGCNINNRLAMPIVPVTNTIMTTTTLIEIPHFDLANCKAKPIANLVRGLPAGSRTVAHQD